MEETTKIVDDHITKDGDNVDRDAPWVSPEVLAAMNGFAVDFGKDLSEAPNAE